MPKPKPLTQADILADDELLREANAIIARMTDTPGATNE